MKLFSLNKKSTDRKSAPRGFTIVELLVTISIIVIVTGIRYSSFNNSVLLRSQAYELALDLRQAQVFGVSASGQNAGNFRSAFGINVNLGSGQTYTLFQDTNNNNAFDDGEAVEVFVIDPRFTITGFCVMRGFRQCFQGTAQLAILFQRPDYDAVINYRGNSNYTSASIQISTGGTDPESRNIIVEQSGNIYVQ